MSKEADALNAIDPSVPAGAGSESAPTGPESDSATPPPEPAPELTSDQLRQLQDKAAKADAHWDLYLRARADLDNFRKRTARERQEAVRYAGQGLVEKLLPVLDSLDMALAAANPGGQTTADGLRQGIALVQGQFKSALSEAGVQEIDATGQAFDPNVHEAVSHQESAEVPDGHVLQQLRKGYRLHERLLRPAAVIVAKKPEET